MGLAFARCPLSQRIFCSPWERGPRARQSLEAGWPGSLLAIEGMHGGEGFGTGVLQSIGPPLMQSCLPRLTAPQGRNLAVQGELCALGKRSLEEVPLHRRWMLSP